MKSFVVVLAMISILYIQATPLPAGLNQDKLNLSQLLIRNDLSAIPERQSAFESAHVNASDGKFKLGLFKTQSHYLKSLQPPEESTYIIDSGTTPDCLPVSPPTHQRIWFIKGSKMIPSLRNMPCEAQKKDEGYASWLCSLGTNPKVQSQSVTHCPAVLNMGSRDPSNMMQINHQPLEQIDNMQIQVQITPKNGYRIHTKRSDQPTSTSSVQEKSKNTSNEHLGPSDIAVIISLVGFVSLTILIWSFGNKLKQILTFWKK